jgi:hypothetical protein
MGQGPSSGNDSPRGGNAAAAGPAKTCYYEILSIERTATPDEYVGSTF